MASQQLEEVLICPKTQQNQERKHRPHPEQALKCPRCASTNTKFCYYNNYSFSQPRYFCKGCRRYWTQGGSLRNVPVGGGCRKNKRSSSSSSSSSTAKKSPFEHRDLIPTNSSPLLPTLIPTPLSYDPNDLTLAFAGLHKQLPTKQLGLDSHNRSFLLGHSNCTAEPIPTDPASGFLDILRSDFIDTTASPSGLNNLYFGFGLNGNVEVPTAGVNGEEALLSSEGELGGGSARTVTSEGSYKDVNEGETKTLMGLRWQVGGDGNIVVNSGRDCWTAVGSSWHGLINSSLM